MESDKSQFLQAFHERGFALLKEVVASDQLKELLNSIEGTRRELGAQASSAGTRHLLKRNRVVRKFARAEIVRGIATQILGKSAKPVKAILFDKTPDANWYVTWHQDLTIAVEDRIDLEGYGPWSVKDDIPHVQPPASVLENIVSLRIHLDNCPPENGPIKFIAGSHRCGILSSAEIANWRETRTAVSCSANRGDVIVMRPLVLHSSSQATLPNHRRVLHIEYVGAELPSGLKWAESSGLDTVEMVMAIEEEFGIEIPNDEAERMTTVGRLYEFLKTRLASTPSVDCLTQRIFYKLRRSLVYNYQLQKRSIMPDTRLNDLLTEKEIEEGWPYLQLFVDLKTPEFKPSEELLGFRLINHSLTMRDLVSALIRLNAEKFVEESNTDKEIWRRMVEVIVKSVNVNRDEVTPGASFTRDLGMC
jgi:acyl carrier protein/ectoine hydroxylase-related dioxygenase (phytanoyl-CoA dioxygenase family)